MTEKIAARIQALEEFLEILNVIGISKDYGSGLSEAYQNEIRFLKSLSIKPDGEIIKAKLSQ